MAWRHRVGERSASRIVTRGKGQSNSRALVEPAKRAPL
uniref:Uncharacterized protein n=1 Tax=Setaria italica TaxID=4555 RepID=K3ZZ31_SETIT